MSISGGVGVGFHGERGLRAVRSGRVRRRSYVLAALLFPIDVLFTTCVLTVCLLLAACVFATCVLLAAGLLLAVCVLLPTSLLLRTLARH